MGKIIGIDLGTTNSVVAVMEGGKPKVIPTQEGSNLIPSIVEPDKQLVGQPAKNQMILNPKNTIFAVKRLMGRRFDDPLVKKTMSLVPYEIVSGPQNTAAVKVKDKVYTPQEISAKILAKAKADAESYLGEEVKEAVITVPAYFDDSQRQATKQAGKIAGLEVKRILNEPTAAALAYGLDKNKNETIAVYDLGGGTFDISILELGDGVFEVKSTAGDTFLGGEDFNRRVMDWILEQFKKDQGVDLSQDKQALQRVRDAAEKAKIELSTLPETEINLPFITQKDGQPLHLTLKLTRAKLEELVDDLIQKTLEPVRSALKDAKLQPSDIDEVILVGGQTRMPKVQEVVKNFFGKTPHKGLNPDEVVAIGAAIQAGIIAGEVGQDIVLVDVTPLTLGIETLGGVMTPLIPRNTAVPTKKTQVFSTASDNQTQVEIHVLQGERPMAADNKSLGRFILDGIPPAPRGVPQIEVTFDIDSNGILHVSAKDKATGKEQKITIQNATQLSEEEVERMRQEAEKHKQEDEAKKALAEKRNEVDAFIFSTKKALDNAKDKISEEDKKQVTDALDKLDKTLQSAQSADELSQALQDTIQKVSPITSKLYTQSQSSSNSSSSGTQQDKSNDAEEGEVVN